MMLDNSVDESGGQVIQRLEPDPRDPDRIAVTIGPADGSAAMARTLLLHIAVVAQEALRPGLACPPAMVARLEGANAFQQYYARALNFLAVRPRSEAEVRRRLREKGTPPEVIDAVVARLLRVGYLDDAAFARFWIGERARSNPRGARLLRSELRTKGVAPAVIDQALTDFEEEAAPVPGALRPPSGHGVADALGEESREVHEALGLAQRKLRAYASLDPAVVRRRLSGFLLRRGYGYGTVARVLKYALADAGSEVGEQWSATDSES
jgi:regulatory protein